MPRGAEQTVRDRFVNAERHLGLGVVEDRRGWVEHPSVQRLSHGHTFACNDENVVVCFSSRKSFIASKCLKSVWCPFCGELRTVLSEHQTQVRTQGIRQPGGK